MAEAGTLCINADVEKLSGADAHATADAEAYTNVYIQMAEGFVCLVSRYDWVTNYASISTIGQEALRIITSAVSAALVMNYSLKNYPTKVESQVKLDIIWSLAVDGLNLLRDDKYRKFILDGVTT